MGATVEVSDRLATRRHLIAGALGVTAALAGLARSQAAPAALGFGLADQEFWRFCGKCNGMFFSGENGTYYRQNQRCPAGGPHYPMGFNFVLPYNVPATSTAQPDWRFCGKCNGM